jgi:hypothetical protein
MPFLSSWTEAGLPSTTNDWVVVVTLAAVVCLLFVVHE